MKYILKKDLPTYKAGTPCHISSKGNLVATEDCIVVYATTLSKFPNILTEWFEPVPEKRKAVPDVGENYFVIPSYGEVSLVVNSEHSTPTIDQGNWRWTREEAEAEVAKRAAIERVRRFLVENDLLEEDKKAKCYYVIVFDKELGRLDLMSQYGSCSIYSPYGRVKDTDLNKFLYDCREDLLLIHS